MKYTIVINQYAITKLGLDKKTDLIDWAILDYLKDWTFAAKKKTLTLDGKEYIWINYNHMLEQMPLLGFKDKHSVGDRIKKFKSLSLIETFQSKDNTLYFRFTHNIENLFFDKAVSADNIGYVAETTQGLCGQDNTAQVVYQSKENTNEYLVDFFELLWKPYPRKEGKGGVSKAQKEKLHKIGIEEMTRAISRYIKAKSGEEKRDLQMGSTFFNSGYVDYLDKNYQADIVKQNNDGPLKAW